MMSESLVRPQGSMGPIPLTWADPEMQTTQQGKDDAADEAANADNRMVRGLARQVSPWTHSLR